MRPDRELLEDASNWAVFAHNVGADVDDWQTSIDAMAMGYFRAPSRSGACVGSVAGGGGPITVVVSLATAGVLVRLLARPPAASSTRPLARAPMASGTVRRGPPAGWPAAAA